MDRLVRHEQKVKVEAIAQEINDIFFYSQLDLSLIASLPILEDYNNSRYFKLNAATEYNHEAILKLFNDFLKRAGHYCQIRYLDRFGQEVIKKHRDLRAVTLLDQRETMLFRNVQEIGMNNIYISEIVYSSTCNGNVIHLAKAVYSGLGEFDGVVVIDLDFDRLDQKVKKIHLGSGGYAFLIDEFGSLVSHPTIERYSQNMYTFEDISMKNMILKMIQGDSGWTQYTFGGQRKGATFAPIPIMKWAIAITIPISELKKEAFTIREKVIDAVAIILFFAVIVVSILAYYLIKPVRALVEATKRIAGGDLHHEIPIQSRDELGDLTSAFNHMVKTLARTQNELIRSEKLISLGRLSAGVAHEVRNPLNAMKGAIEYLQRRRGEDRLVNEYTQLVSEEIDRLSQFVSEFLYFAKELTPKPTPTDINDLISTALNLFHEEARKKSVRFHLNLSSDIPVTFIDPAQMTQVVLNLLINAMDALPAGGDITISSGLLPPPGKSAGEARIRVVVEDNGVGMTVDQSRNIFDPFFTTKDAGTGLGLPISLGIVENHGGQIQVASHEGSGTSIIIEWPLHTDFSQQTKDEP